MSVYNYMNFPLDADMQDFAAFPEGPRVGSKAPDGKLVDVRDGRSVRLSEYFRKGVTVIEFGSFT
ncbi:MAG: hypothetical protein E2P02_09600 [Acidobacteria bacterium]|nr:MAG: hypothetical protein E2P02_09600 [Acidobacteriota bacterium]